MSGCCNNSTRLPIGPTGPSGGSGGSGNISVGESLFVSKTGNDTTGLRERFDKMFLTVQAAINAASLNDTVFIYPGIYSETITLVNGVNLQLMEGARIEGVDGWAILVPGGVTCEISGNGEFFDNIVTLKFDTTTASTITITGVNLISNSDACIYMNTNAELILNNLKLNGGIAASFCINYSAQSTLINSTTLVLNNIVMVSTLNSLVTITDQNIKIYSAVANQDIYTGGGAGIITNLISGTTLYVDSDVI